MLAAVPNIPSEFRPYLLGDPACTTAPETLVPLLENPETRTLRLPETWKIILVAQSDLPELFDALSLARRVHEFVADPTHNLQDHFVVSHQFLYLQGPDLYYIYPTTPNVGDPPSETQVKNLAEMMISQGLPFACNTHAQGLGGRLILENFVSPCRDKEAKTTRIPTQLFVRLVRLGAGLSETAKLKSKYPQHQSAIEHIEKTHIRKITVQMITQLGVSLLICYAIKRYLNPNLTAKDSIKSIFSPFAPPIQKWTVASITRFLCLQEILVAQALSYPFTITRRPSLTDLVNRVALPLIATVLLGRYVIHRPLTRALFLSGFELILSPLNFIYPLVNFAGTRLKAKIDDFLADPISAQIDILDSE